MTRLTGSARLARMILTVTLCLVLAAFICAVASAAGKCPLWVAVILLCLVEMIRILPLGR